MFDGNESKWEATWRNRVSLKSSHL